MKSTICLCLLLAFDILGYSQLNWARTYRDSCYITTAFQMDSSYVGVGHYADYLSSKAAYYYLRTDFHGDTLAERIFEDPFDSLVSGANSGLVGAEKSILIAGFAHPQTSWELRLLKMDTLANIQWIKTYPNTHCNGPHCKLITVADAGFALFGEANLSGYFIKTDLHGNQQFRKDYGLTYMYIKDAIYLSDSSYTLCGYTQQISQNFNAFLLHVDSVGNIIWARSIFGSNEPVFFSLAKIRDHYYVSAKDRLTDELYISKFDLAGNNQVDYALNRQGILGHLAVDANLNLIATGAGYQSIVDSAIFLVLDTTGNVLMERAWISNHTDQTYSCFQGSDNAYVAAGKSGNKSFMARIDSIGFGVSLPQPKDPQHITIHPNPVQAQTLAIQCDQTIASITVHDIMGNLVYQQDMHGAEMELLMDFPYPAGIYILGIHLSDGTVAQRKVIRT